MNRSANTCVHRTTNEIPYPSSLSVRRRANERIGWMPLRQEDMNKNAIQSVFSRRSRQERRHFFLSLAAREKDTAESSSSCPCQTFLVYFNRCVFFFVVSHRDSRPERKSVHSHRKNRRRQVRSSTRVSVGLASSRRRRRHVLPCDR